MLFRFFLTAMALCVAGLALPARAGSPDKVFFESVTGAWSGPGEIVAGKYKGTKFVCKFTGEMSAEYAVGVAMDGRCRVGMFSQNMSAFIGQRGNVYSGQFQNGADGDGLDIISGRIDGNTIVVGINRKRLTGAMVAELREPDVMNVTISVQVQDELIPVIGLTLSRANRVGSTGSDQRDLSR